MSFKPMKVSAVLLFSNWDACIKLACCLSALNEVNFWFVSASTVVSSIQLQSSTPGAAGPYPQNLSMIWVLFFKARAVLISSSFVLWDINRNHDKCQYYCWCWCITIWHKESFLNSADAHIWSMVRLYNISGYPLTFTFYLGAAAPPLFWTSVIFLKLFSNDGCYLILVSWWFISRYRYIYFLLLFILFAPSRRCTSARNWGVGLYCILLQVGVLKFRMICSTIDGPHEECHFELVGLNES